MDWRHTIRRIRYGWVGTVLLLGVLCSSVAATPFQESFEDVFPPNGWITAVRGFGNETWQMSLPENEGDIWGISARSARSESSPILMSYHWLITPPVYPTLEQNELLFYLRTQIPSQNGSDTLFVLASVSQAEPESFTDTLAALLPGPDRDFSDSFIPISLDLSSFDNTTIFIAFVHAVRGSDDNNVYLDEVHGPDLSLEPIAPTDPFPEDGSTDVDVSPLLSWQNPYNPDEADVYLSRFLEDVESFSPEARIASHLHTGAVQPPSNLLSNTLYYWRVIVRNDAGEAFGSVWSFTTGIGPLVGNYRIGVPPAEFSSLNDALAVLTLTGIDGPTVFHVAADSLTGPIIFPAIPGASESSPLTFVPADSNAAITVTCSSSVDSGAITFDGASYLELSGFNVVASGNVKHCLFLKPGSHHITIRNAVVRRTGPLWAGNCGICARGPISHHNRFENLQIRNAVWGVNLDSPAGGTAAENTVEGCTIDSVRGGIRLIRQANCRITGNDIDPNAGSYDETDGIWIGTTHPSDTVFISKNKIDQVTTAGVYAVGIRVKPDSASAVIRIFNNFIYDFRATGTAQVRAVFVSSGQVELTSNSILINDITGTGNTYALYNGASASQATVTLQNNIFANTENTNVAYNIFPLLTTASINSDYNIFFGSGNSYRLGRWGTDQTTLTAWQTATGGDYHSLEGDPGFISPVDLHMLSLSELAHQNGITVPYVFEDIDGEMRLLPPDRGADEYALTAPPNDFAVLEVINLGSEYEEFSDHFVRVAVQNRGSAAQIGVPLRLLYNEEIQDEISISLEPLTIDTLTLHWFALGAPDSGWLKAQCLLADDARPDNDSAGTFIRIIPAPLAGTYQIGGPERDFNDFNSALSALSARGVTDSVDFLIAAGTYDGSLSIPEIPGASIRNRIRFAPVSPDDPVILTSSTGTATISLNGAKHIYLDGLNVQAIYPNTVGLLFNQNCDSNNVYHCTVSAALLTTSSSCGIRTSGGGCNANRFSDVTISGFYYGIRLEGMSGNLDYQNIIEQCSIQTSRTALQAHFQDGLMVRANTIQTGHAGAVGSCCGLSLGYTNPGKSLIADGNLFIGNQSADTCIGIYANTGGGTAVIRNNMLSAWNVSGTRPVYGVLIGGGTATVHFNSLWMNELSGSGPVFGIADTGMSTVQLSNNVIQISEGQNAVWCISHDGSSLISDYNAFCITAGSGANRYIGKWDGENANTLVQWQNMAGLDEHSVIGDPGFADSLNLHIRPNIGFVSNIGSQLPNIGEDFDGDVRENPPDIGADEYVFRLIANDFGVKWASMPSGYFKSDTTYRLPVLITNYGYRVQNSVPVRLYFDDLLLDEAVVSLSAGSEKPMELVWPTGVAAVRDGMLKIQCFLPQDSFLLNDSTTAHVTIIGPPLQGNYFVGVDSLGTNPRQFCDLEAMTTNLRLRGIAGPLTLSLARKRHEGPLTLSEFPGLSPACPIVISADERGGITPPEVYCNSGEAALILDGADFVQIRDLTITAADLCTTAVVLKSGACQNSLFNCSIHGADSSNSATAGIWIQGDGCSENMVDQATVGGAFTGIAFKGGSGITGIRNSVRNSIIQHARYGIYVSKQTSCSLYGNDIQPGSTSNIVAACYGIYITGLNSGSSVAVFNNQIHGFSDASGSISNRAVGIFAAPTAGAGAEIFNNFIYDFTHVGNLKINPIYLSSGDLTVLHNSILIDDVPEAGETAAIYISTGDNHVIANNVLMSRMQNRTSYGILQANGSGLNCNGNDIFGDSPQFMIGRISGVSFPDLTSWQQAGYDSNGLSADPGFISSTNLHICETSAWLNGRGIFTPQVTFDIDGQRRSNPPDIGADEYCWQAAPDTIRDLMIQVANDSLVLSWSRAGGAMQYHIYRGSLDVLVPGGANLIATVTDTCYHEPVSGIGTAIGFYIVTADDQSGSSLSVPHEPLDGAIEHPR